MKKYSLLLSLFICSTAEGQTLGGRATYNFLQLPATPQLTALGGVNTSYQSGDVQLSANNPALLGPEVNGQLNASFNSFFGSHAYSLTGAYTPGKGVVNVSAHIYFVDYGSLPATDAAGNSYGNFRPVDFVAQASVSKRYLEKWTGGLSLKVINSSYQRYTSFAVAVDVGILYADSLSGITASFLAKNMGAQLKTFAGQQEELPFDLQIGFTKRLARAPLGFSLTAQRLHRFDITYNDAAFNSANNFTETGSTLKTIFNHLVAAGHIYLNKYLEASISYNFLRHRELSIPSAGNGLTGFSGGLRIIVNKLQVMYARSAYQRGVAYNQIGITARLTKLFTTGL